MAGEYKTFCFHVFACGATGMSSKSFSIRLPLFACFHVFACASGFIAMQRAAVSQTNHWQANIKSSVLTCWPVLQPVCPASLFQFVCPYSSVFTCSPEPVASSRCNAQRNRRRIMAGEYKKLCSHVFACFATGTCTKSFSIRLPLFVCFHVFA
jgi:hypothetical protein